MTIKKQIKLSDVWDCLDNLVMRDPDLRSKSDPNLHGYRMIQVLPMESHNNIRKPQILFIWKYSSKHIKAVVLNKHLLNILIIWTCSSHFCTCLLGESY